MADPVVIVDPSGNEHEFPPGFDPKKAAAIVRQQVGGVQPSAPPVPPADTRSGLAKAYDVTFTPPAWLQRDTRRGATMVEGVERAPTQGGGLLSLAAPLLHPVETARAAYDIGRGLVQDPVATIRGGAAGAVEGWGSLLTPGDVALTAVGAKPVANVLRGVRGGTRAAQALQTGVGAATVARGAERVATAESPSEAAAGVAQIAFGAVPGIDPARQRWKVRRATRQGAESTVTFKQSVPPSKSTPYTDEDLHTARPYLNEQHAQTPIEGVVGVVDAADASIGKIEQSISDAVAAFPTDRIRVDPIARARAALTGNVRADFVEKGLAELAPYGLDQPKTLAEADAIRKQLNAENAAVRKRNNYDRYTARQTDPGYAAREAALEALRDGVYQRLEARGVQGVRRLRQDEGSLIAIRNAAERQRFAAERPVSGTGKTSVARRVAQRVSTMAGAGVGAAVGGPAGAAAGGIVGERVGGGLVRPNMTRDALMARSFELAQPTAAPTLATVPPQPRVAGLLEAPAIEMRGVPDPSFVRSVPDAEIARQVSGTPRMLGPGARVAGPASTPDPSFVRSVPDAEIPRAVSGLPRMLGPGARPMPAATPPPSGVVSYAPAAPMAHVVNELLPVANQVKGVPGGGYNVHYSSDPTATPVPVIEDPAVINMLQRMKLDLETIKPERGGMIPDVNDPGFEIYARGGGGSYVNEDMRIISGQNKGQRDYIEAIDHLLAGGRPTNKLHTAAIDAALGYLEKRSGYRGPQVTEDFSSMPQMVDEPVPAANDPNTLDAEFEAFSQMIDDFAAQQAEPELVTAGPTTINASGESAASAESIARMRDMGAAGQQFVVYDRAGNGRPIIGPEAVDYQPRPGETFGVQGPEGFRVLTDNGGRPPR